MFLLLRAGLRAKARGKRHGVVLRPALPLPAAPCRLLDSARTNAYPFPFPHKLVAPTRTRLAELVPENHENSERPSQIGREHQAGGFMLFIPCPATLVRLGTWALSSTTTADDSPVKETDKRPGRAHPSSGPVAASFADRASRAEMAAVVPRRSMSRELWDDRPPTPCEERAPTTPHAPDLLSELQGPGGGIRASKTRDKDRHGELGFDVKNA